MANTPRIGLPEITASQSNKNVTHNQALAKLDALTQSSVKDRLTAPPGSPVHGDCYLVIATATGAFAGHENDIAQYYNSAWQFYTPSDPGWEVYVEDEGLKYTWTGAAWIPSRTIHDTVQNVSPLDHISINWALGHIVTITLDRNVIIDAFTGGGGSGYRDRLIFIVKQDATGGWGITWSADVRYGTDLTSLLITATPSKQDYIGFVYDAAAAKYDAVTHMRGY
jgi:hypothetical protein